MREVWTTAMSGTKNEPEIAAIRIIADELDKAIAAAKCHQCGCLQQTAEALSTTPASRHSGLAGKLVEARATFKPKRYDCLGCPVCHPAIAANAFGEAFPEAGARLDLCPTGEPELREGWPPLPGDYHVLRYGAPVAVCTLNSTALAVRLDALAPDGLSIVGTSGSVVTRCSGIAAKTAPGSKSRSTTCSAPRAK